MALDYKIKDIPAEERAVYAMISRADTIGVFQIESRAQMSMLPRLRPNTFYDLVIEVAIVRPGPIQGDMVHPYLQRRQGPELVNYPSKELEEVLKKTLGVPLFQEQAMKIAIVAAGFTPAEADRLRRAMATFKRVGIIETFRTKMVEGMVERHYPRDFAERCFKQIEGFGSYGFPESHAASFALLVYASAWIKCRYPDVFACALLNAQPMGFYAPAQIVRDAREHGIAIEEVDVNFSQWDCTLEDDREPGHDGARDKLHPRHVSMQNEIRSTHKIRLGFRQVQGIAETDMATLVDKRGKGYDFDPRSLAAHGPCARHTCRAGRGRRFPLARLRPARCALGRARPQPRGRQGRSAAVEGFELPRAANRKRICRRCRSANMSSRITGICPVAEGASRQSFCGRISRRRKSAHARTSPSHPPASACAPPGWC